MLESTPRQDGSSIDRPEKWGEKYCVCILCREGKHIIKINDDLKPSISNSLARVLIRTQSSGFIHGTLSAFPKEVSDLCLQFRFQLTGARLSSLNHIRTSSRPAKLAHDIYLAYAPNVPPIPITRFWLPYISPTKWHALHYRSPPFPLLGRPVTKGPSFRAAGAHHPLFAISNSPTC